MSDLDQIVEINISRETQAVSRAAFNVPMFLATHTAFSDRAKEYTSLVEVASDFRSTSNVYIAASKLFGQEISPSKIIVGRRQVDEVTGTITVQDSTAYVLTINGTVVTYTSDSSATTAEIIDGLEAAFTSAGFSGITFTDVSSSSFRVAVSASGTAWSIVASTNITLTNTTPTETWADALTSVSQANDVWFALVAETHLDADILALAGSVEALKKMYWTSSSSSDLKTSSTSDIASQLKAAGYNNTSIIYSAVADTMYPECAWVGGQIPETPGSNTYKFKQLAGVTVDTLSASETTYLKNKNCNYYKTIGGVNITAEGVVASGEYIDVINKAA